MGLLVALQLQLVDIGDYRFLLKSFFLKFVIYEPLYVVLIFGLQIEFLYSMRGLKVGLTKHVVVH